MLKSLGITATIPIAHYLYRTLTEYETNIEVKDKNISQNRYFIQSDKGIFTTGIDLWSMQFDKKGYYNKIHKGEVCHVRVYGIDCPKINLYRRIVFENGTPCAYNHCKETKSIIDKYF